jgi:hypothetical protein
MDLLAAAGESAKVLFLDSTFAGPLGLLVDMSHLRSAGISKILKLPNVPATAESSDSIDMRPYINVGGDGLSSKPIVFLTRPEPRKCRIIAAAVREIRNQETAMGLDERSEIFVFFVLRRAMSAEQVFVQARIQDEIRIGEFSVDLIPFDNDVLSLELTSAYMDLALHGDRTPLFYVARSIARLQSLFGIIPRIMGKGSAASLVLDMVKRLRREAQASDEEPMASPEIDTLILIDREVDMVTPMLTQLTYEGLIDEVFGISNGVVELPPALAEALSPSQPKEGESAASAPPKRSQRLPLNSNDKLYAELRDANFATIGPLLNARAKRIEEYYHRRKKLDDLKQIKEFIRGLGGYQQEHQSLKGHAAIAEHLAGVTRDLDFGQRLEAEQSMIAGSVVDPTYLDEVIARKEPMTRVLRLLCLRSLTSNGIKPKQYEQLCRDFLQTYGYEHLSTLRNLRRLGLFRPVTGTARSSPWTNVRRSLNLVVEDLDEKDPRDIAYTFSGYAPLSCRLVEQALRPSGWSNIEEVTRVLPGSTFNEQQELPKGVSGGEGKRRVVVVYYIGGVTFAEIAALRFLAQSLSDVEIVIAATSITSGDRLVASMATGSEAVPLDT